MQPEPDLWDTVDPDAVRARLTELGIDVPTHDDLSVLGEPLNVADRRVPNRLCVQPMEGKDADDDGGPGTLTTRRYLRYAHSGFGLLWVEAAAVTPAARTSPSQLCLHDGNVEAFTAFVTAIRHTARTVCRHDVVILLQLAYPWHSAPTTDAALDRLQDTYLSCARRAGAAGFDGVDVKACHDDLVAGLLSGVDRPGAYGGSFENRTVFLRRVVHRIKEALPERMVATRLTAYDPLVTPRGFGTTQDGRPDPTEPIALVRQLAADGLDLLNVTTGLPPVRSSIGAAPGGTCTDPAESPQPPQDLAGELDLVRRIQQAVPSLPVVGGVSAWFGAAAPFVAAGLRTHGDVALVGFGRSALAYPDLARYMLDRRTLPPERCCIACAACSQLLRDGGPAGCVIRDAEIYGPAYRHARRTAPDHLAAEALRCHLCRAAPCSVACPAGIDVPAFIGAVAEDEIAAAYAVLHRATVLPGMCSALCPGHRLCESQCIEEPLSGVPIPICRLHGDVARRARDAGHVGLSVPARCTDYHVAVIGGGPAGLGAAMRLLEHGHRVTLIDREQTLGGLPEVVIPTSRYAGSADEIEAVLRPAHDAGRLTLRLGTDVATPADIEQLETGFQAVLLATGLWQELSLGSGPGVQDALSFLRELKQGTWNGRPRTVAVLAGGDSAMDAALAAHALGPDDLYVLYGGAFADLHWHLSADWFRETGVHGLMLTDPLGYARHPDGALEGVRICRTVYRPPDPSGRRLPQHLPGTESVLEADLVIEAMGLGIADTLKQAVPGLCYSPTGLVESVQVGSFATHRDHVYAAGALLNGGATVTQCISEGMRAADEISASFA